MASTSEEEEVQKIVTVNDTEIIEHIDRSCANRDYVTVKPVYVDFETPAFRCRSYDYKINLDGDGNIGGCLRQVPPNASFGNIFRDADPYNSSEMRRLRRRMRQNDYPHTECRLCFGSWSPTERTYEKLIGRVRVIAGRLLGTWRPMEFA